MSKNSRYPCVELQSTRVFCKCSESDNQTKCMKSCVRDFNLSITEKNKNKLPQLPKKVNMLLITRKESFFFSFFFLCVWLHLHVYLQTLHLGVAINSYDFSLFLFYLQWSIVIAADSVRHKMINTGIEGHSLSLFLPLKMSYIYTFLTFHLSEKTLVHF